jgi:E3 ubiquitin-protein ligase RNF5
MSDRVEGNREGQQLNIPPAPPTYEAATSARNAAGSSASTTTVVGSADDEFICNVCLDPVKNPVVTQCGHLYCWPCLFRWLNTSHTTCPVCKASVSQENVIPIFLGGSSRDPRISDDDSSQNYGDVVPNRPQGQRPEPQEIAAAGNVAAQAQAGGGISFTGNYGFFPSLFGLQFQEFVPPPTRNRAAAGLGDPNPAEQHEQFLYHVLLGMGSVVFLCFLAF